MSFLTATVQGANGQRPSFRQDFTRTKVLDPRITFTRNSPSWRFNSAGIYEQVGVDTPVFDYDPLTLQPRGLRIWESSTNYTRNSAMVGAVVGTVGSGGLLPNLWTRTVDNGVTCTIVETGNEKGLSFIDLRFQGITESNQTLIFFQASNLIPAATGQTWTTSTYAKRVSGSFTNLLNLDVRVEERNSSAVYVTTGAVSLLGITSSLERYHHTRQLADPSTAYVNQYLAVRYNVGVSIDFTIRIAAPQLEQKPFVTPFIPTTGSAVTREADTVSMSGTNFSSWYNPNEGTPVIEFTRSVIGPTNYPARFMTIGGHLGAILFESGYSDPSQQRLNISDVDNSTSALLTSFLNATAGTVYRMAASYKLNQFRTSGNGGTILADETGSFSTQLNKLWLGQSTSNNLCLNGHLRYFAYYPKALPDQVQKLSTLNQ